MRFVVQVGKSKERVARDSYERMRKSGTISGENVTWEKLPYEKQQVHRAAVHDVVRTLLDDDVAMCLEFAEEPKATVNTEQAPASAPAPAPTTPPSGVVRVSTDEICKLVYHAMNGGDPAVAPYESVPTYVREAGVKFAGAVLRALEVLGAIKLEQPAPIQATKQADPTLCACPACKMKRDLEKPGATPEQKKALATDLLLLMLDASMARALSNPTKLN